MRYWNLHWLKFHGVPIVHRIERLPKGSRPQHRSPQYRSQHCSWMKPAGASYTSWIAVCSQRKRHPSIKEPMTANATTMHFELQSSTKRRQELTWQREPLPTWQEVAEGAPARLPPPDGCLTTVLQHHLQCRCLWRRPMPSFDHLPEAKPLLSGNPNIRAVPSAKRSRS